jgi:hypothetical protein
MSTLPTTDHEIEAFLHGFESCTLTKSDWTHSAHLLAGAWYVHVLGADAALDHMRICIRRFNISVGGQNTPTSGYHETLTVFWIKLLDALLRRSQPIPRADFANLAVATYSNQRDIFRRFYDFDVVNSTEARATWIPPINPLDA